MKQNILNKIPSILPNLDWSKDAEGNVVLQKHNRGIANRVAQIMVKKPKISYIQLDPMSSFVWLAIDGKRNILAIGKILHQRFGKTAEPLYERLAHYIKTLYKNNFITLI